MVNIDERNRKVLFNDSALSYHFNSVCKLFESEGADYNESLIFELAKKLYHSFLKIQELEKRVGRRFDSDERVINPVNRLFIDSQSISLTCDQGSTLLDIDWMYGDMDIYEVVKLREYNDINIPEHRRVKLELTGYATKIKLTQELNKNYKKKGAKSNE